MDRTPDPIDRDPQETQDRLDAGPDGARADIHRSLQRVRDGTTFDPKPRVQLFGSGATMKEVMAAAELLERDFDVSADVWNASSYAGLRRDAIEAERWNRLHPTDPPRTSVVQRQLAFSAGPLVAVTDDMRIVADQMEPFVDDRRFLALGSDGFGLSDTRQALRAHSEVNRHQVVVAALKALADDGLLAPQEVANAIARYGIDAQAGSAALA